MNPSKIFFTALVAAFLFSFSVSMVPAETAAVPGVAASLNWRLVGPFRGGWTTAVEGVPTQPDTFYFAGAGGGIWRTTNAGRTWQPLFEHGPAASVGALAVAQSDPRTIYVGTGQPEPRFDIAAGMGVFKSTDGGATWTSLGLADTRYIGRIWVDPKDANLVLVGAQGHFFGPSPARGLFRSTDGGKTWAHVLKIDNWTGIVDIAADPQDSRILFASSWEAHQYPWQSYFTPVAGRGSALYKSVDSGATWQRLSGGGWPGGALGRIGLAVTRKADATRIYAAIDSKTAGGLYRSDDAGAHWARVNKEDAFTDWYASRLTVAPNDPDIVYTVGQSIRRCMKGGAACEIFKGAPGGDDYHHVWINPLHPDHMIAGSDQGAVVSVDGGATWSSWYNQPTGQFYHLAADNRFPYWIYCGQQDSGTVGIASRSDYGAIGEREWHPVGGDERDYDIPDPADPEIVYGSGLGGRVTKYDSRTGQVQNVSPWPVSSYGKRPTLTRYHYLWVTPLVASLKGPASLYLGAQVLFQSKDRAQHWTAISGDLTGKVEGAKNCDGDPTLIAAKTCGYGVISTIAPSPLNAGEIWVGTADGLIQLTRDAGKHWSDVTPHGLPLWTRVSSLDLSAKQAGVAYAAIDGHRLDDFAPHVLVTHDYGATWQNISAGLPRDHLVSVVRADPVKPGLLYAGTDEGVFVSLDDGAHWSPLGANLPTAWVNDLLVHGDDLIAATQGRAIWAMDNIAPLRELTLSDLHLFVPAPAIRVHANMSTDTPPPGDEPMSPNPPAGAAIDYWLTEKPQGAVTLEIRDASGATVRHFASDVPERDPKAERYFTATWLHPPEQLSASPGFHRFMWNLHWPRPRAIKYGYSIAAVWGVGTPIEPQGPFVLPGNYAVVLTVDGHAYTVPLHIAEDPRVKVTEAELKVSLDLSNMIAALLAQSHDGYGEREAVKKQLDALFPPPGPKAKPDPLRALADRIRKDPEPPAPTFQSIDGILTGIESDLESVDAAPTQAQRDVVADTQAKLAAVARDWASVKSGPLAQLNAALAQAKRKPVTIPPPGALNVEAPDPGQDLP